MYNKLTPEIIEEIKKVSSNVFLGEDINPDYAKDEMPIYGTHMPDLAVQPRSTEEVAAIMKICYDNNIPVTPRGAGTGLAGGAVPVFGGVLMDISKMNKIKSYDMENFVVEVEGRRALKRSCRRLSFQRNDVSAGSGRKVCLSWWKCSDQRRRNACCKNTARPVTMCVR